MRTALLAFVICLASTVGGLAHARDCPETPASTSLAYVPPKNTESGIPMSHGVIPPGFIRPSKGSAIHGIGVSKYQTDVDFVEAQHCGARFAVIRITAGWKASNEQTYKEHWRNAKSVGLFVAPYHNLVLYPDAARAAIQGTPAERVAKMQALVERATEDNEQIDLFVRTLTSLLASDPVERVGDVQGRLFLNPILDLSYDPLLNASPEDRRLFTPVVKAAACHFVRRVKEDAFLRVKGVVIFVPAKVWRDYDLGHTPCALGEDGVALSVMTRDGDTAALSPEFSDICDEAGKNRCVFEHYSAFAPFVNFDHTNAGTLFRYYGPGAFGGYLNAANN